LSKLTVLVVPVADKPYLKEVNNDLETFHELVGGYIEVVPTGEGFNMVCNEEGKIIGLEPNIQIHGGLDFISGQFIVCKNDAYGEFSSITQKEANEFLYLYVIGKKVYPNLNVTIDYKL
jgi:hypothetical protein